MAPRDHGVDRADADHRHVEAHILVGLATLTTVSRRSSVEASFFKRSHQHAPALQCRRLWPSMAFHSNACLRGHHTVWPMSNRPGAGHAQAILDVLALSSSGARSVSTPFRPAEAQEGRRTDQLNPFRRPHLGTAPSSMSVERWRRFRAAWPVASRDECCLKICLCFTWPAITAAERLLGGRVRSAATTHQGQPMGTVMRFVAGRADDDLRIGSPPECRHDDRKTLRPRPRPAAERESAHWPQ